jgi:hypothetical protein
VENVTGYRRFGRIRLWLDGWHSRHGTALVATQTGCDESQKNKHTGLSLYIT